MRRLVVSLIAACALAGCFSTSARHMVQVVPPQPIVAPPGQAMVLFVRPSNFAFAVSANILDETGRFLGDMPAKGHFAAAVPPGRHLFVVWAENTDVVVANLLPGRIYFVEVSAAMGTWSANIHMKAIKPSLANWAERDGWVLSTTQYAADLMAGQANLSAKGDAVPERLRLAQEQLARYQGAELDLHTLNESDGL